MMTPIDFPGYFAGASLKGATRPHTLDVAVGLPRLLRRGLIEARRPGDCPCRLGPDFPGYFAGASLEHRTRPHRRKLVLTLLP